MLDLDILPACDCEACIEGGECLCPPAPSPPVQARTISERFCRACRWNDAVQDGFCAGCAAEVARDLAELDITNARRLLGAA